MMIEICHEHRQLLFPGERCSGCATQAPPVAPQPAQPCSTPESAAAWLAQQNPRTNEERQQVRETYAAMQAREADKRGTPPVSEEAPNA